MQTPFEQLCISLDIHPEPSDEAGLERLKRWCVGNVSFDADFEGSFDIRKALFVSLVRFYLDVFSPKSMLDPHVVVPEFFRMTPIQCAAQQGFNYFLEGLEPSPALCTALDQANDVRMTPLHVAASQGYVRTVRALLNKGANPRVLNGATESPLFSALFMGGLPSDAMRERKEGIFRVLIKLDIEAGQANQTVMQQSRDGSTIAHRLIRNGFNPELLALALKCNPMLATISDNAGVYPIHLAISRGRVEAIRLLLAPELPREAHAAVSFDRTTRNWLSLNEYARQNAPREVAELCAELTKAPGAEDSLNHQ